MPAVSPPDPPLTDGVIAIRSLRDDDAAAVTAFCDDPSITRWIPLPSPYTEADFRIWQQRTIEHRASGEALEMAIVDTRDVPIGSIGLKHIDRPGYAEIGYLMGAPSRGRGYTTRALRLLRDWAARQLGVERIDLLIHHDNQASQHVARAAGFSETGEYRPCPTSTTPEKADHKVFAWPGAEDA